MGYYNLFDFANCKHFRFAQWIIDSPINTKVHCYFEFCKTYLIFFFFDESEVVPNQFRNKAIPNSKIWVIQLLVEETGLPAENHRPVARH
jgi:hypothetical protein